MSATPTQFDASRPGPDVPGVGVRTALTRLYRRDLGAYPATGRRMAYLAIVVLTTVVLYYMLYIQYAVATSIITHFDMTYRYFVWVSVVGNAVGAFSSLLAGLADRWGRANMVVYGLLVASLLVFFGLPNAGSKSAYLVLFALVSFIEGIVLVATPALIRDFSPQLGRATAMGVLDDGTGGRQPGRHHGHQPHPRARELADRAALLGHRRVRWSSPSRSSRCASCPRRCATRSW